VRGLRVGTQRAVPLLNGKHCANLWEVTGTPVSATVLPISAKYSHRYRGSQPWPLTFRLAGPTACAPP
jgi:hypothetical protein